MTHAYNETYLYDAMRNMGEMMDYAVNDCHMDSTEYFDLFITSGIAEQFGKGHPKYIAGLSGIELVWETYYNAGLECNLPDAVISYERTPEYWCGWILAYYQWIMGKSFKEIVKKLPVSRIIELYPTLHEASEEKFVDVANQIMEAETDSSKLQTLRRLSGYSQRILAEKSGVNLRTLQQYEIHAKDINKASANTLVSLSRTLGCTIEDLLE